MMSVMDFQMKHGCSISGLYGLMDKVKQEEDRDRKINSRPRRIR